MSGDAEPCDGCVCPSEHDGDYGSSGHAGPCPPHTCVTRGPGMSTDATEQPWEWHPDGPEAQAMLEQIQAEEDETT